MDLFLRVLYSALIPLLLVLHAASSSITSSVEIQVGVILDLNTLDSSVGRIGLSCLKMAYSDFYSHHKNYKTRLVLHVRDSNGSVVDSAAAAVDFLNDIKVDAIIGPQKSKQVNFVMDLGDKAHIPIISFSATNPSLIHRTPYFVQTAQSDDNQVQAIASIVQAFKWSQVVLIYEDTELGNGIIPYLTNALQDVNARVSYRSVFRTSDTDDFITIELLKMMTMQTRVFVVHASQFIGTRIFVKAKELGMMSAGYAWIVTSGLADLFSLLHFEAVEAMQGVLGVKPLIPKSTKHEKFAARWIREFSQANHDLTPVETSIFGLWAYDTLCALAIAAEKIEKYWPDVLKNDTNVHSLGLRVSETGPKLLAAFLETNFTGVSGEFNLVNGKLEQTPYEIVNVLGRNERVVGTWIPPGNNQETNLNGSNNYSISNGNFKSIIWPGDSTVAPRGWEIPVSGKKLRVGVPQKPGFNEFLKVEIDPQTKATQVTGYFKEVFELVITALPYAIPHEYVAYPFFDPNGLKIGSYDDLVYQVSLQEHYDVALGDITITADRSIHADFTLPIAEGGLISIVPIMYENVDDMWAFLKPLTKELWLVTAIFYISTSLAIWILGTRIITSSGGSEDAQGQHAGMICYFPLFPGQGIEVSLLCVVIVAWAFVASLLNSTYTASLSSRLTVQRLQPTVTDIMQLIKSGQYVGTQEGSFIVNFLIGLGFDASKIRTYNCIEDSDEALTNGSENGGISAYWDVLPHIKLFLSQYCGKYMMVEPPHRTVGFGFVFPKGSSVVADFSRAVIQLTENGTIMEINEQISAPCSNPKSPSTPTRVTLRSFFILFSISGFVTVTCLFVSLIIYLHKQRALLQRISDIYAAVRSRTRALKTHFRERMPSWV